MTASTANLWAVAGLVYALAGASLLALSIFAAPQPAVNAPNSNVRRSLEQWLDARIGAALIVIGFFLQMTGSIGTATLDTPAVFVLLGLALAAGYYGLSKDLIVDKLFTGFSEAAAHDAANVEQVQTIAAAPVLVPVAEPEPEPASAVDMPQQQVVIDLRREGTG